MLAFATYIPQPLPYLELHAVWLKQALAHQDPPYLHMVLRFIDDKLPAKVGLLLCTQLLIGPSVVGRWLGGSSHSSFHARCHCWLHLSFGGLRHSWLHVSFGGLRFGGPGLLAARFVRGHAGSSPFLRAGYIRQEPLPWHLETA